MNKKLKTLIIDGEPMALEKLRRYVEETEFLEVAGEFKDTAEALEYMAENAVDVIFTEIAMPGQNGIDFVESLAQTPLVVFVSAQSAYAVDAYRLSAVDFLSKPYGMVEYQRAAKRIEEAYRHKNPVSCYPSEANKSLFIRNEKEYERVLLSDILYISGDAEYLAFHISGRKMPLREKSSFADVCRLLPANFVQIHRSSIVNMDHVKQVGKMYVVMDDGNQMRISGNHRDKFYSLLKGITVGKKPSRPELP